MQSSPQSSPQITMSPGGLIIDDTYQPSRNDVSGGFIKEDNSAIMNLRGDETRYSQESPAPNIVGISQLPVSIALSSESDNDSLSGYH